MYQSSSAASVVTPLSPATGQVPLSSRARHLPSTHYRQTQAASSPASPVNSAGTMHATFDFPYAETEDQLPDVPVPAKPMLRPSVLKENCFILPGNSVFVDKVLPPVNDPLSPHATYPTEYFVALHKLVSAPGSLYPANTPNHIGARIPLQHTKLNIPRWRYHLTGYDGSEIVQFLEFGFPIGLMDNTAHTLVPTLRNHGSIYQYYSYLDKFHWTQKV